MNIADKTLTDYSFLNRITKLNQSIIKKDDIEFVTELLNAFWNTLQDILKMVDNKRILLYVVRTRTLKQRSVFQTLNSPLNI